MLQTDTQRKHVDIKSFDFRKPTIMLLILLCFLCGLLALSVEPANCKSIKMYLIYFKFISTLFQFHVISNNNMADTRICEAVATEASLNLGTSNDFLRYLE